MSKIQFYKYGFNHAGFVIPDGCITLIQGDTRESDGFQKKKYSVDFQLEMDLFVQK